MVVVLGCLKTAESRAQIIFKILHCHAEQLFMTFLEFSWLLCSLLLLIGGAEWHVPIFHDAHQAFDEEGIEIFLRILAVLINDCLLRLRRCLLIDRLSEIKDTRAGGMHSVHVRIYLCELLTSSENFIVGQLMARQLPPLEPLESLTLLGLGL